MPDIRKRVCRHHLNGLHKHSPPSSSRFLLISKSDRESQAVLLIKLPGKLAHKQTQNWRRIPHPDGCGPFACDRVNLQSLVVVVHAHTPHRMAYFGGYVHVQVDPHVNGDVLVCLDSGNGETGHREESG